jgi:beta-1,4-mannooligosaccharide phosphorylase
MKATHFSWQKKNLLFAPNYGDSVVVSHSALPFLYCDINNDCSVYFTARDHKNRSHALVLPVEEIEAIRDSELVAANPNTAKILLTPGDLGTFDDSGAMSSWVVESRGKLFLYYTGWTLGKTVPFYFGIGLAVSEDCGKTFNRISKAPILGLNKFDPFLVASPCVICEGDLWKMWYVSGDRWEVLPSPTLHTVPNSESNNTKHYYRIKYAESKDGINWVPQEKFIFDFADENEYSIARPSVVKVRDGYLMWYSYRGEKYKIGLAASFDGFNWQRVDELAGIKTGDFSWEDESICYAHVAKGKNGWWMLYNGNNFGQNGVGVAWTEKLPAVADLLAAI